jgi:AraC-like DNA-binding protein
LDETAPPSRREPATTGVSERIVVRRPADLEGLELMTVRQSDRRMRLITTGFMISAAGPRTRRGGWNENRYRGQTFRVVKNDIALLEPEEPLVQVDSAGPSDCLVFTMSPAFVASALEIERPSHLRRFKVRDDELDRLLWGAYQCIVHPDADPIERETRLAELIVHVFSSHGERVPSLNAGREDSIAKARELIEDRYAEPLRLDDIAKETGISKFHLERKFRARFGVPVHQFTKLVRVRRALERLRRDEALSQVAIDVGFADQAHMTRVFRQTLGITPGVYRRGR